MSASEKIKFASNVAVCVAIYFGITVLPFVL